LGLDKEELTRGGYIFETRCVGCHTIGKGDGVGPDLAGVMKRRNGAWVARYVNEPDRVLAERNPVATALLAKYKNLAMPNLGLPGDDVAALVSYLEVRRK
jgi:protein SCO1/2